MKKIFTILFSLIAFTSFSQSTVIYNKLKNDGVTFGGKDTVVKNALSNAVNNYFTGYGTWGSLPDTVRTYFSVDTSGTSGGATYTPSTGVFHIPKITGGSGSSSTVQQDSNLLIATKYLPGISLPYAGRAGLLLRDTANPASTNNNSPAILWQVKNSNTNKFYRLYVNQSGNLYLDYATDTAGTWTNCWAASANNLVVSGLTMGQFAMSGSGFSIGYSGQSVYGSTSANANAILTLVNTKLGFLMPVMTTLNKLKFLTNFNSGTIVGGTGGTNGSYNNVTMTGGSGTSGIANITIAGNTVTAVTPVYGGYNFKVGDVLTASVGGVSGFTYTITKLQGDISDGIQVSDSALSKPNWWDSHAHILRVAVDSTTISGNLTVSSASTLTLVAGNDYIFNGSTSTYSLPAISATAIGRTNRIYIKNRGSGTITLNAASGSTIYDTATQSTISITAGQACELLPDGTYFNVMYKQ